MNISLRMPVSDAYPTSERYSERNIDDDLNDEEPGQELDSSWRNVASEKLWRNGCCTLDMARKATDKYQKDASQNDSPDKRVYVVDLQKAILLPELPGNKNSIFLSRLIVVNETLAKVHPKDPGSVGSKNLILCAMA